MPRGVSCVSDYLDMFDEYFSSAEKTAMHKSVFVHFKIYCIILIVALWCCSESGDKAIMRRFYTNWALKETLVKALGCGIGGFALNSVRMPPVVVVSLVYICVTVTYAVLTFI